MLQKLISKKSFSCYTPKKKFSITFLLFTAKWCGACKYIEPLFETNSEIFKKYANFEIIDVDSKDNVAVQYKVLKIPTIIVLKDEKSLEQKNSQMDNSSIEEFIKKHIKESTNKIKTQTPLDSTLISSLQQ
jgi:thioredoxin 1